MALKKVFLIGSNRAEFEHVYGPLTVDSTDPRFVLVDEETEEKIVKFPNGVPPFRGQDWPTVEKIREHEQAVAKEHQDKNSSPNSGNVAETGTPISTEEPTYGAPGDFSKGEPKEKAPKKDK